MDKESIPAIKDFNFTEFDQFLAFLDEKGYEYETDSEKVLKRLKKELTDAHYLSSVEPDIAAIEKKIELEKKNEISKFKGEIINMIEKSIVSRYFYQKGKIEVGLKNDEEIKEAITVLSDSNRYNQILGN